MYADFGGYLSYDFKTENCFASQSNCNLARFNRAYHINTFSDEEVEAIKIEFGRVPFTWTVQAGDFYAESMLEKHEFIKYPHPFSGMKADIKNITDEIYAPHITIKEIDQGNDIDKLVDIISVSHSIPEKDELRKGINSLLIKGSVSVKLYLGFYEDVACAASIIIYHKDIVTLHMIGTLPEYRSKGLGYAVTHKPLVDAALNGINQAVLMASSMGQSLYKKMGFEEYAQYHVYIYAREETYKL
jgi:hypothetical protein